MLQLAPNPLLTARPPAAPGLAGIEAELNRLPHLADDRRLSVRETRRRTEDARKAKTAAEALGRRLPDADEAIHMLVSGKFALAHFVPAIIDMAGQPADEVTVATLGFSRGNIADWANLLDGGRVGRFTLLCSHYFSKTSAELYNHAAGEFGKRPAAAFLSVRNHAKLVLLKFPDRTVAIESSANARSCENLEQATAIGDPRVYAFHRQWIGDLFDAAQGAK